MTHDIRPGDVIDLPFGIEQTIERAVVHTVVEYADGSVSLRWRYFSNPRGVDWRGYVAADEDTPRLVGRGVCAVDPEPRSLLPGG